MTQKQFIVTETVGNEVCQSVFSCFDLTIPPSEGIETVELNYDTLTNAEKLTVDNFKALALSKLP